MPPAPEKELIMIFQTLQKDEQDFVRLHLVDSLPVLFSFSKVEQNVFNFLKVLAEDPSWRIRYVVCDRAPDVYKKKKNY